METFDRLLQNVKTCHASEARDRVNALNEALYALYLKMTDALKTSNLLLCGQPDRSYKTFTSGTLEHPYGNAAMVSVLGERQGGWVLYSDQRTGKPTMRLDLTGVQSITPIPLYAEKHEVQNLPEFTVTNTLYYVVNFKLDRLTDLKLNEDSLLCRIAHLRKAGHSTLIEECAWRVLNDYLAAPHSKMYHIDPCAKLLSIQQVLTELGIETDYDAEFGLQVSPKTARQYDQLLTLSIANSVSFCLSL